ESLLGERAGEHDHPAHHATVIVNRGDLAALPRDQHDLPVVPEQDGVSQVAIRRKLDAVDVAFGLARDALAETARSRPLRPRGVVANHLLNRFGEGHWKGFYDLRPAPSTPGADLLSSAGSLKSRTFPATG